MKSKLNCWDIKGCGRGPSAAETHHHLVCPVATCTKANSVNGGQNGGRVCWAVYDSPCPGRTRNEFGVRFDNCMSCDVLVRIKEEEGENFILLPED